MGKGRGKRAIKAALEKHSYKSKFLNPDKNKRSYKSYDLDAMYPPSKTIGKQMEEMIRAAKAHGPDDTTWHVWNDPCDSMTQKEYMEYAGISYERHDQSKLWFGSDWAGKSMVWRYDPGIDAVDYTGEVPSTTSAAATLTAISNTIDSLTEKEDIDDLKARVTVLEAKIDMLDTVIKRLVEQ